MWKKPDWLDVSLQLLRDAVKRQALTEEQVRKVAATIVATAEALAASPPSPPPNPRAKGGISCSFCGKSQREVRKLISGPQVYICEECIRLCNDILADEARKPRSDTAATEKPSG